MEIAEFRQQLCDGIDKTLGSFAARWIPPEARKVLLAQKQLYQTDEEVVRKLLAIFQTMK